MANFIKDAIKKPGALRKALKTPEGKDIPAKKLAIKSSDTTLMKQRKNLAKTLRNLNK